ncbi:MAG TPA: hypothetical protein VFM03_01635 [Candidatus Limnocylindria bacterium]|nr:hypothetical protein [Candidatus Limnocylindria bacterium]
MTAPAWAAALVHEVCADAGLEPPRLIWRRRNDEHSTGVARRSEGTISVRAGHDPLDQRLTLLHELAHWLSPAPHRRRGSRPAEHHGLAFYRVAFELYRRHGIPTTDALRLESARYRSSLRHAAALGVEGAVEALRAHRAALRERGRREWRVLVPEHPIRLARDGRWSVCETCGQRVVGSNLARVRRARRPICHVLLGAVAS